jgi:hypothetical protein
VAAVDLIPPQARTGAFLSQVHRPSGVAPDENGFVTALVCDALWPLRHGPGMARALGAALDYLERCADPRGGFNFYPPGAHPAWMARPLPPDMDDTALIALVLWRYGRLGRDDLATLVQRCVPVARLDYLSEASAPWHRPATVATWIDPAAFHNPVDVIVNLNTLALLKKSCLADARVINEFVGALKEALSSAGTARARLAHLCPWYPEPFELVHALARARRFGVTELGREETRLRRAEWARRAMTSDAPRPIFGSDDGRFFWTCGPLDRLRRRAAACEEQAGASV